MSAAKGPIERRRQKTSIDDLEGGLATSVKKSYRMLSDAERDVLNTALDKYQPGQAEPILVGGAKLIKPALRLMTRYRLVIEETKDSQAVTSYTRWVDAVEVKGSENQEVYLTFSPRFERIWPETKKCFDEFAPRKPDAIELCRQYPIRLYTWAKNHLLAETKHLTLGRLLFAALAIGLIYFFSNPRPWTYFDYTFRSARALVSGSLGIDEPPPSWMTEMIPFESHYYSAFPFGSVLTLVPMALLQKVHVINEFPTMAVVGVIAGCSALLLLLFALQYNVSWSKRGILVASMLLGSCMWCNLAFGGTWQLNLGFAVVGQMGALYFTRIGAPLLAGACFALAFGNRTEIILLVPVFFYLLGDLKKCAKFSIAPLVLGLATLLYNYLRFHAPLDFGYARIPNVFKEPWYAHGIFSIYAVTDNIKAMLLDPPFRVLNQFPYLVPNGFGGSIFLSSPFLFLVFKPGARDLKMKVVAWVAITLLVVPLWLHGSPGGWQFSYRYMMILLPWMFVLLLEGTSARVTRLESALCAGSILINAWASYVFLWTNYVQP
ncbi:MAG: replication initiation protein [Verrucomicrobia bacterium]|nr:replication initiation protein [Verrucomicrobiota bacterium]